MNGIWKSKIGGFNEKGVKRKKVTLKRLLSDTIRSDYYRKDSDSFEKKYNLIYVKFGIRKNPSSSILFSKNRQYALKSFKRKRRVLERLFLKNISTSQKIFDFKYDKKCLNKFLS